MTLYLITFTVAILCKLLASFKQKCEKKILVVKVSMLPTVSYAFLQYTVVKLTRCTFLEQNEYIHLRLAYNLNISSIVCYIIFVIINIIIKLTKLDDQNVKKEKRIYLLMEDSVSEYTF